MTQSANARYCWVRVLCAGPDVHEAKLPDHHAWPDGCSSEIGVRIEGKKPKGRLAGPVDTDKASPFQVFGADEGLFGRDGALTWFDLGPAFVHESDARKWITEGDGKAWDKEALNRFLICYDPQVTAPATKKKCYPNGPGKFPLGDWSGDHVCLDHDHLHPAERLFAVDDIVIESLDHFIQLAGGPAEELKMLLELQQEREKAGSAGDDDIYRQGYGRTQAATAVFRVLGFDTDQPVNLKLKDWRERILDNLEAPLYRCKKQWNRERPWTAYPTHMRPLFYNADSSKRHASYPGHPAFPGGHALVANTFALLLSERFPERRLDLLKAAEEVSLNRERAGLHYRSDSLAGAAMAAVVVAAMKNSEHWKDLRAFLDSLQDLSSST